MPLLVLLVTDKHNAETIGVTLPAGTVYTTIELSDAEWAKTPARLASEYMLPVVARTQQQCQVAR